MIQKLRQEKFDESAELRSVYEKLVSAVGSVAKLVRSHLGDGGFAYPYMSEVSIVLNTYFFIMIDLKFYS